jgi:UDP-3-O-[3-hydroxymyristoyl] glucosamine N-acyltransferase
VQIAEFSLGELAVRFGLTLRGDPSLTVARVATLHHAGAGAVSFLANARYRRQLESTRATAVLVAEADAEACPVAALIDPNPYLAYARIAALLHPAAAVQPGVHPSAVIDPGATVPASATLGEDSRLMARVTLYPRTRIGRRCILHAGVVIGADGFGFAPDSGGWLKVPQVGGVRIGDDVEVGANTTIDCGAIEDTVIEDGVKLDNQIQVGHNVSIGAHTAIAGCTGISGSTTIGRRCMIGGMVGIAGHLSIADDVIVTGVSLVSASIRAPGSYSSGMPAVETRKWRRMVALLRRLDRRDERT